MLQNQPVGPVSLPCLEEQPSEIPVPRTTHHPMAFAPILPLIHQLETLHTREPVKSPLGMARERPIPALS